MIRLKDEVPFAEGDNRLCFVDPGDAQRCLKVLKPGTVDRQYQTARWHKRLRGRRALDDNLREAAAYRQPAITKGTSNVWEHLARWYGQIETDLGTANVTQLVGPRPGVPGPTLESFLKNRGLTPEIESNLHELAGWLQNTGILTRNLLPHNIVAKEQPDGIKLFIIDGLGAPVTARVLAMAPVLRKRYINRRIRRMWLRARWEAGGRQGRWEDVEQQDR